MLYQQSATFDMPGSRISVEFGLLKDVVGQVAMDRATDLLQYLRQQPEELEWATAGPRRDKSQENRTPSGTAKEAQKPLALLEHYCKEGKISHGHIDDRQALLSITSCQYDISSSPIKLSQNKYALQMFALHRDQQPARTLQVLP